MTRLEPHEVARRAAQRDTSAFAQLYDEHLNTIYRYVFYRVGNGVLAEELTAEVFSKAWERIDRFQWRNLPFQNWLITIARNVVVDHWRSLRRVASPIDDLRDAASDEAAPDEQVSRDMEVEALRKALLRLPDDQRDVLILRFIEGMPHAEVAAVLGKSIVAVRQIQSRALRSLQKLLIGQGAVTSVTVPSRAFRLGAGRDPAPSEEPAG
jgi:RNA polymerase sigma-70 factor (ECF subfamily)